MGGGGIISFIWQMKKLLKTTHVINYRTILTLILLSSPYYNHARSRFCSLCRVTAFPESMADAGSDHNTLSPVRELVGIFLKIDRHAFVTSNWPSR